ncbi:hypothetical protein, partial [Petrachloros mirabilis]
MALRRVPGTFCLWLAGAARDHRPDFDLILVGDHLILGHEFVATDHQVGFNDEIELSQDVFGALGTFDFHAPVRMAELDLHDAIIGPATGKRQADAKRALLPLARAYLEVHLAQTSGRFFRRDRVDVEPSAPFE